MNHLFFVKSLILLFLSLGSLCIYNQESKPSDLFGPLFTKWKETTKTTKNKHLLEHNVSPIDTVRIAIIGLGNRGQMALERLPKKEFLLQDILEQSQEMRQSFYLHL